MPRSPRVLVVDNYDSFTWNLAQYVAMALGVSPRVVRNDELSVEALVAWEPDAVILSPGPGSPEVARDVGVCAELVERLASTALLGVCLGHQVLGVSCGARVIHAPEPRHGRLSKITHDGSGVFAGLPSPLEVVRYHSLVLERASLPASLRVVAETEDGLVMAIAHRERPHFGVQFHPESIKTQGGVELVERFLRVAGVETAGGRACHSTGAESELVRGPHPTLSQREGGFVARVVPWCEPERAFVGLYAGAERAFWLDGNGRFAYMGAGEREWVSARGDRIEVVVDGRAERIDADPFEWLSRRLESRALDGNQGLPFELTAGFVGCLGYELKSFAGGDDEEREGGAPDLLLMRADRVLAFDRETQTLTLTALLDEKEPEELAERWFDEIVARLSALPELPPLEPPEPNAGEAITFRVDRGQRAYLDDVARIHRLLRDGETYEICLTTQLRARPAPVLDPLALFRMLRRSNPAPYAAFLRFPERTIVCASPERFVHIDARGAIESRPIKGTRPRGTTPDEDARLAADLATSEKDRAENLMIVDLVRNDLGRVCEPGSVRVPRLMEVETHPSVFQLVSTVQGQLARGTSPVEAVRSLFPGGSMTGAPKIRAMRIISELERRPRGLYSGALGFFSLRGAVDLAMTIRTVIISDEEWSIGVGGAVVALSEAASEYDEARTKARALLDAIARLTNAPVLVED